MNLGWKIHKTKHYTIWTAGAYSVQQHGDAQVEVYWGWVDANIRAELESPVYFDIDRARGFCEGHHARH